MLRLNYLYYIFIRINACAEARVSVFNKNNIILKDIIYIYIYN